MHSAQPQHIDAAVAPKRQPVLSLRLGVRQDEGELLRLFDAFAAANEIDGYDRARVLEAFDRAIRHEGGAEILVVGMAERLAGYLLIGRQYPFWSPSACTAVLSVFVEPEFEEATAARKLVELSRLPVHRIEATARLLGDGDA
jgi:hypothetical protein